MENKVIFQASRVTFTLACIGYASKSQHLIDVILNFELCTLPVQHKTSWLVELFRSCLERALYYIRLYKISHKKQCVMAIYHHRCD